MRERSAFGTHDLTFVRLVRARLDVVWRLWTDPRHLAQWWGPDGFTNPECSIDPWPGGAVRILMRSPDGEEFLNVGTVRQADVPACLAFTIALLDGRGGRRLENLITVHFAARGNSTEVTVHVRVLHASLDAQANLAGMRAGWTESLERLALMKTKEGAR